MRDDEQLLLGIDVGTTGTKAALFSLAGQLEGVDQVEYPIHHIRPGWVEQDPEDWWAAVCSATRRVLAGVRAGAERVAGVAVSSQAPTLLAVDASGSPLRPAIIWMDRRAEREARDLERLMGLDRILRITRNRPDAYFVAPKLLWLRKHERRVFERTYRFLQIPGFVNQRFTGEWGMDAAHAALTGLRDYAGDCWSAEICDACGVDPSQFPPVRQGHELQGVVTQKAACETGLAAGTKVMVGTVDGAAAAVEAGVVSLGMAAEMTGTSTVLLMPTHEGIQESAFIAMPHAVPEIHLLLGAMVASGASLKWFRDQLGQPSSGGASEDFDRLTATAAQVPVGSDGVIFLPYMMGERSPLWHTQARGVFFGLSLATTRGALVRSLLEGTAFALRHNVEIARRAGVQIDTLRTVGGGARSPLWNQIKADVLGIPILIPQTSVGAPFGDAVLAGLGLGFYSDLTQQLVRLVKVRETYEPNRRNHDHYTAVYDIFRRIYRDLRDDFDRLAEVLEASTR